MEGWLMSIRSSGLLFVVGIYTKVYIKMFYEIIGKKMLFGLTQDMKHSDNQISTFHKSRKFLAS
jgi:hypothetical protein